MKTMKEIMERLTAIRAEAQAIIDAADNDNNGVMGKDEQAAFDALMEERETLEAKKTRLEQLDAMGPAQGRRTRPSEPAGSAGGQAPAGSGARSHENIQDDPLRGFRDAGDFAAAVRDACMPSGDLDDRLRILGAPSNFHRETGSSDGYMVPPAVRDEVWRVAFGDEGLLQQFAPEPTSGNQVQLFADESTPWGATGVQANWASEGNQFSPSRLATKGRTVQLHKLYAFVLATEELVADAARLASRLTLTAGQAINYKATDAIVTGDGVGKPLGYMDSGALVSVAKESGQAAATVVAANVAKMYARLLMGQGGDAFWLVNQDVLPQLMTMTLGDQPIWTPPSSGFANAPGGFLLGRPIRFSEHCETLGTLGDVQLVNPRGYYAATKQGGVSFASSIHLYFDYDIEAFRWTFRLGGQPYLSAPVSPAKGSATKSHFVALATRS